MQELNLRLGQAVSLTYAQEDENFKRLKTAIDALEVAVAGAGLGTVTSVGLALPNIFTVTISPVTTTGSLTATLASQSANRVFASPTGASGQPTFRILDNVDLPVVSIAKGGLNLTTIATANQVLASNLAGTAYEGRTISVSGGLTVAFALNSIALGLNAGAVNINDLLGVLVASKGGTGVSAAPANGSLLIGNGTAWTNTTLTAGTGIAITSPSVGNITISTSGVVTQVGGVGDYIPRFSTLSANVLNNSILFDTGARIGLNTAAPSYELDVFPLTGGGADSTLRVRTNTGGFRANLRLEDASNTTTFSSLGILNSNATIIVQSNLRIFSTGNVQASKGFAVNGWAYWNVPGTYTFASNELYGVVLGTASDNTMTIALPTAPMDGQEICILCEETKILTLSSAKTIFGHNAGVNIDIQITGGAGAGGAAVMVKYAASAGPTSVGAWFITGL
jgi:hypothetical protein